MEESWSGLEITKLVLSSITPILIVLIGYLLNNTLHRFENAQWANRKLVEHRLKLFDEIAPLLNDLFCFYTYVGNWKELSPPDIIECKRKLDKIVHINLALFSQDFHPKYKTFLNCCFKVFNEHGADAKLLTKFDKRKDFVEMWKDSWNSLFLPESKVDRLTLTKAYQDVMDEFSRQLGISKAG